jgi:hypothetical protein
MGGGRDRKREREREVERERNADGDLMDGGTFHAHFHRNAAMCLP